MFFEECLAGVAGFEPANGGAKGRCLTTWLYPNIKNEPVCSLYYTILGQKNKEGTVRAQVG